MVDFGGRRKYHPPQFTWFHKVVSTGITFLNLNNLGSLYRNDMFVADAKNGNIYHFKLNEKRTDIIILKLGPLSDKVVDSTDSLDRIILGRDFGAITILKQTLMMETCMCLLLMKYRGQYIKLNVLKSKYYIHALPKPKSFCQICVFIFKN